MKHEGIIHCHEICENYSLSKSEVKEILGILRQSKLNVLHAISILSIEKKINK